MEFRLGTPSASLDRGQGDHSPCDRRGGHYGEQSSIPQMQALWQRLLVSAESFRGVAYKGLRGLGRWRDMTLPVAGWPLDLQGTQESME